MTLRTAITATLTAMTRWTHRFGDLEDVGVRAFNFPGNEDAGFVSFADYFRHDQPCSISIRAPEYS